MTSQSSPRSATHRQIPPEVIDYIVDFLHDDYKTLANCSLTCRSWLPRARYHKFSSMRVTHDTRDKYLKLLHTCPDVWPYIQRLRLDAFGSRTPWTEWGIVALTNHLPNLHSLTLKGFSILTTLPLESVAHLRELMFHSCYFTSLDTLLSTLVSISSLQMLSLQGLAFERELVPSDAHTRRHTPSYRLTGLDLHMASARTYTIMDALLAGSFYEQIEILCITSSTNDVDYDVFHRVINTMSSVRVLRVYGLQGLIDPRTSSASLS